MVVEMYSDFLRDKCHFPSFQDHLTYVLIFLDNDYIYIDDVCMTPYHQEHH